MFTSIVMPGLSFSTSANSRCSFRCLRFCTFKVNENATTEWAVHFVASDGADFQNITVLEGLLFGKWKKWNQQVADRLETRSSRSLKRAMMWDLPCVSCVKA